MSTQTAINDLSARIQSAFTALAEKGADLPAQKTTYTLKTALEDMQITPDEAYAKIKYQDGSEAFFEITGILNASMIPNLSDAAEFNTGVEITDIAAGTFSDCSQLTSITIHNKTWQDAIDNSYWGISDPNIMHGDWDRYLNFTNAQSAASTVKLQANGTAPAISLLSSLGANNWQPYDLTSNIQLTNYGDRVFLKAETTNEKTGSSANDRWTFVMAGKIAANGNIMSLLDGENEIYSLAGKNYCFSRLFYGCNSLISPPILPATILADNCYYGLFTNCSNLLHAPELPAKEIKTNCYKAMFTSCTSIQKAPDLIATVAKSFCYYYMFYGCTALQHITIKLQNITKQCCSNMLQNCSNLQSLKVEFITWAQNNATIDWLTNAGTSVPETTFICPNQLDVSTRSNNTVPEDTGTHTWNIQPTLDPMMAMLEDYPKFKDQLPAVSSDIFVDYMLNDKASDNTVCNTRALVEEKQDMLSTINTPWIILGYNKTIPQYVKYRRKNYKGTYDYLYVSSVDDTTIKATVDGIEQTIAIKHGFENAQLIDENDQTGLLRPIAAGCKTYTRNNSNLPFGETSQFTATNKLIQSVSEDIAENIEAKDGKMHTYGNNNPYDCPASIVVGGKRYRFCGYTLSIQSKNLLTGNNGTSYLASLRFDAPELSVAEAFNRYENGKEYYKRSGTAFTKMTPTTGDPIFEAEVYEKNGDVMLCKSAYVQAYHEYNIDSAVGTLITDSNAILSNNFAMSGSTPSSNYGCNKWCQSDARVFLNSKLGASEFVALASKKKNPFEKNSTSAPQTMGMSTGNGLLLKFAKANEFMKFIGPSVNRSSIFDKQYNTEYTNKNWRGSFVPYKNLEDSSCNTLNNKVYRSHDVDNFFLLSYTEVGFTNETINYDKNEATSDFTDVYNQEKRIKYLYESNGQIGSTAYSWWLRASRCSTAQYAALVSSTGTYTNIPVNNTIKFSPACTLY